MTTCDAVQDRLAEIGAAALQGDDALVRHLAGCAVCRAFLEDLRRLDEALDALPEADAPDALVAATLEKVRQAEAPRRAPMGISSKRHQIAAALAASVVLAASVGLTLTYLNSSDRMRAYQMAAEAPGSSITSSKTEVAEAPVVEETVASPQRENKLADHRHSDSLTTQDEISQQAQLRGDLRSEDGAGAMVEAEEETFALLELDDSEARRQKKSEEGLSAQGAFRKRPEGLESDGRLGKEADLVARLLAPAGPAEQEAAGREVTRSEEVSKSVQRKFSVTAPTDSEAKAKTDTSFGDQVAGFEEGRPVVRDAAKQAPEGVVGGVVTGEARALPQNEPLAENRLRALQSEITEENADSFGYYDDDKNVAGKAGEKAGARDRLAEIAGADAPAASAKPQAILERAEVMTTGPAPSTQAFPRARAQAFLQDLDSLEGLSFQEPLGYWANSYIPGDPQMRLLQAELSAWDRSALPGGGRLEQAVRQVEQPFDAPVDAALALYLHADKTALEGPTRLKLQVGIKGAERLGGQRPDMNLALVLDLRDLGDPAEAGRLRALVTALDRARRPGDRFSLVVAGPDGGLLLAPEQFLHGPVKVALERLFAGAPGPAARPMEMFEAMTLASETLRQGDDPNAVLGSSLMLLASAAPLTAELPALERLAHENAVGGLALSVVRLGGVADSAAVDRLVAAGQGHRRVLDRAAEADALMDRELHAASRAVARALRLRIRLAPGVQLVDVLGSARLDDPSAELVREAEVAIDQRLARNLGIEADRGEDEEGIQVVIPSFYAGDDHVILLDVVAERPGPIAEVTLRYKDVASHRNGVARASLDLASGAAQPDPLALNVLKNRVAFALSQGLKQAGRDLAAGDLGAAQGEIIDLIVLIQGLRLEVAGWSGDGELTADEALLYDYLAALVSPVSGDTLLRQQLASSMTYAAFRKLQAAARSDGRSDP